MTSTKKSYSGILIDPSSQSVSAVTYDGDFRSIYRLLGCSSFDTVRLSPTEVLYVDDEGLLKPQPGPFFMWEGYSQPLAGKGLILGLDSEGDSVSTGFSVPEVSSRVSWPAIRFSHFEDSNGYETHPLLGEVFVSRREAKFEPLDEALDSKEPR